MKAPLQTSFPVPHKSIDTLKLQQIKLTFVNDILSDTDFSKYLQDPRFSKFFSDVLWYTDKNFAPIPHGYKTIFSYLTKDKSFASVSSETLLESLPSYQQAKDTLELFKSKEQDFMDFNTVNQIGPQQTKNLYNWLIIFMEWVSGFLYNFQEIDMVKWTVIENTNNLLTGKNLHELLWWWFNLEIFHKMQHVQGFWSELSMFFKSQEVSDIFEYSTADRMVNILNKIYVSLLWKIDPSSLRDMNISEVENLRDEFLEKKTELQSLDYMKMELPAIFWFVSDNNSQRSGYLIYVIEALLNDFSRFLSEYQREDQVD